jgi:transcriptional regulator with XRE-family HTH domain
MPPDKPAGGDGGAAGGTVGGRIRRFREDRGLSLSQLAEKAGVSKGYLSALENDPSARRPSAETLYAVAAALGVTIADLLGRRLLAEQAAAIPESLLEFAAEAGLPEADVRMLASIHFRGEQPRTKERWRYIYTAIRTSEPLDEPPRPER